MPVEGLRTRRSPHAAKDTMDRLASAVQRRGIEIFARIDHAANATAAGLPLRPTELLIFGSAKGGTPMMQSAQTAGNDLPLKVLVWEDATGAVWLSYNEPRWIADRHGASDAIAAPLEGLLDTLASEAVAT